MTASLPSIGEPVTRPRAPYPARKRTLEMRRRIVLAYQKLRAVMRTEVPRELRNASTRDIVYITQTRQSKMRVAVSRVPDTEALFPTADREVMFLTLPRTRAVRDAFAAAAAAFELASADFLGLVKSMVARAAAYSANLGRVCPDCWQRRRQAKASGGAAAPPQACRSPSCQAHFAHLAVGAEQARAHAKACLAALNMAKLQAACAAWYKEPHVPVDAEATLTVTFASVDSEVTALATEVLNTVVSSGGSVSVQAERVIASHVARLKELVLSGQRYLADAEHNLPFAFYKTFIDTVRPVANRIATTMQTRHDARMGCAGDDAAASVPSQRNSLVPDTRCVNCGNADETCFSVDARAADVVCTLCGAVAMDHMPLQVGKDERSFSDDPDPWGKDHHGGPASLVHSAAFDLSTRIMGGDSKAARRRLNEALVGGDTGASDIVTNATGTAYKDKHILWAQREVARVENLLGRNVADSAVHMFSEVRWHAEKMQKDRLVLSACIALSLAESWYKADLVPLPMGVPCEEEGCSAREDNIYELRRHVESVHGLKCTACGMRFLTPEGARPDDGAASRALERHRRVVHSRKPAVRLRAASKRKQRAAEIPPDMAALFM